MHHPYRKHADPLSCAAASAASCGCARACSHASMYDRLSTGSQGTADRKAPDFRTPNSWVRPTSPLHEVLCSSWAATCGKLSTFDKKDLSSLGSGRGRKAFLKPPTLQLRARPCRDREKCRWCSCRPPWSHESSFLSVRTLCSVRLQAFPCKDRETLLRGSLTAWSSLATAKGTDPRCRYAGILQP